MSVAILRVLRVFAAKLNLPQKREEREEKLKIFR